MQFCFVGILIETFWASQHTTASQQSSITEGTPPQQEYVAAEVFRWLACCQAAHRHAHALQEVSGTLSLVAIQQFGVETPCLFVDADGPDGGARTLGYAWRLGSGHPADANFGCASGSSQVLFTNHFGMGRTAVEACEALRWHTYLPVSLRVCLLAVSGSGAHLSCTLLAVALGVPMASHDERAVQRGVQ